MFLIIRIRLLRISMLIHLFSGLASNLVNALQLIGSIKKWQYIILKINHC
jgi:hypothetical protein